MAKVYFPNLNGLRFFAAALVIIHHIEQLKGVFKIPNYFSNPFIHGIGKLGVVLFFVLSGFLITFLLLKEEDFYKKINVKDFYIRRILRIWPLYYVIVFLAFVVLPNIDFFTLPNFGRTYLFDSDYFKNLILYCCFLANLPIVKFIPYASHLWSISTEEQYYLIWPLLFSIIKKHRLKMLVIFIISYILIHYFLASNLSNNLTNKKLFLSFWESFNIDCMAIGGIFAILLFQKNNIIHFLLKPSFFYFVLIFCLVLLFSGFSLTMFRGVFNYEFYAVLFGIIILNFAANKNLKISLEQKSFNYLGKISYGLYMYHPITIVLAIKLCEGLNLLNNWCIYPLAFLFTIGLASFSYTYLEAYFLKLKPKFSKILSGENNKE